MIVDNRRCTKSALQNKSQKLDILRYFLRFFVCPEK